MQRRRAVARWSHGDLLRLANTPSGSGAGGETEGVGVGRGGRRSARWVGEKVMPRATTHSAGPYDIEHVRADCYAMYTNNPPAGAFRGFGVTQSAFAVESMMDMLAEKLNIEAVELRRMNALHVGSVTNTGQLLGESVGLMECIDKVDAEMRKHNPDPFKPVVVPVSKSFALSGATAGRVGGARPP